MSQTGWLVLSWLKHKPARLPHPSVPHWMAMPFRRSSVLRLRYIFTREQKEALGIWRSSVKSHTAYLFLSVHRDVSLLRAHTEASRDCKSTSVLHLGPLLVLWDEEDLIMHLAPWGSEALYLLCVEKAIMYVCSLLELRSLPALFSDLKPSLDVFF